MYADGFERRREHRIWNWQVSSPQNVTNAQLVLTRSLCVPVVSRYTFHEARYERLQGYGYFGDAFNVAATFSDFGIAFNSISHAISHLTDHHVSWVLFQHHGISGLL
ncbi:hypothetical protein D3C80_1273930 [compost metagenome]